MVIDPENVSPISNASPFRLNFRCSPASNSESRVSFPPAGGTRARIPTFRLRASGKNNSTRPVITKRHPYGPRCPPARGPQNFWRFVALASGAPE
jgi:hypothetical protein